MSQTRFNSFVRFACIASGCLIASLASTAHARQADNTKRPPPPAQTQQPDAAAAQVLFDSPQDAAVALVEAVRSRDRDALKAIIGPSFDRLASGDLDVDNEDLQRFTAAYDRKNALIDHGNNTYTLTLGLQDWEFPAPIVGLNGKWWFDGEQGVEEVLNRVIGEHELQTIEVCRRYPRIQRVYFDLDPDGDGVKAYAAKIKSTQGKRDGLYWPDVEGQPMSPIGPAVAAAHATGELHEGSTKPDPYNGYFYRILIKQGPGAPGGAKNYIDAKGQMTGGFALLAWPADYGNSGIMTFTVGVEGKVFQRDLGDDTQAKAAAIDAFDPGDEWDPVDEPQPSASSSRNALPSWNDTPARIAIVDFVTRVTKEGSADFVPAAERVAVFDNDGTLWCEQPVYVQLAFVVDRVKALAPKNPAWKDTEPFKSVLAGDMKGLAATGEKGVAQLLAATHAGMTTEEFNTIVSEWMANAKNAKTGRLHTEMVYQPMLEVLAYLRDNGFKTYIVSGGGVEFMRPWAERVYGIPPEQVVGSRGKLKLEMKDGEPVLTKLPEIDLVDDGPGKPVGIQQVIGRRPIMCFGNSDGDLQMLQWTTAGNGPRLGLIVHHDDAAREFAYDRDSHIGKLDKAWDEASQRGWTVVSMKDDWKAIFRHDTSDNIAGEASAGGSGTMTVIENIKWGLVELNGQPPVVGSPHGKGAQISFTSKDHTIVANTSVNGMGGKYSLDGERVRIESGAMTRMAGPEPLMKQEQAFIEMLSNTASWRRAGSQLDLLDNEGKVIARFAELPG